MPAALTLQYLCPFLNKSAYISVYPFINEACNRILWGWRRAVCLLCQADHTVSVSLPSIFFHCRTQCVEFIRKQFLCKFVAGQIILALFLLNGVKAVIIFVSNIKFNLNHFTAPSVVSLSYPTHNPL